jgi:hypothetical protein
MAPALILSHRPASMAKVKELLQAIAICMLVFAISSVAQAQCEGSFEGDGDVDGSNLAVFAADFGRTDCADDPPCEGDFKWDGDVDESDLADFAADFGKADCPKGVLLRGDPDSPASAAVYDYRSNASVSEAAVTRFAEGGNVVRTRLTLGFFETATAGRINAILAAESALIISMVKGVHQLVIEFPDPGTPANLEAVAVRLGQQPEIRYARYTRMIEKNLLPSNFDPQTDDYGLIDHNLAVRAHAAWNARAALDYATSDPPMLIVGDYFGDGLPNDDFDVNGYSGDFQWGKLDDHGYHVLGIIAADFGGNVNSRGQATGIFPGRLPLRVVDLQLGYDSATFDQEVVRVIKNTVAVQDRNVVLNTSLGSGCPSPRTRACVEPEALSWLELIRGPVAYFDGETGLLETKVLNLTAAGNIKSAGDFPASFNSGYAMARLLADLYNDWNVLLPRLTNTLVVENRINSAAGPFKAECLLKDSKYPGDISAVGTDVWSLTGASTGADSFDGTSMATPQVAGLAAYVWALKPSLTPQQVMFILQETADASPPDNSYPQCNQDIPPQPPSPVIDAYAAVLAVDKALALTGGEPTASAPVRLTILDVADGSGGPGSNLKFDDKDIQLFLEAFENAPEDPDYSRFDLNGDGYTGSGKTRRFDLNADFDFSNGLTLDAVVTQELQGQTEQFNETRATDEEILCYYAYSNLYSISEPYDLRDDLLLERCSGCSGEVFYQPTLTIQNEADMQALAGITAFFGSIHIVNSNLTNLDGLSELRKIGGNLHIITNADLTNINGLRNLKSVCGRLAISNNATLTDLEGLNRLKYAKDLTVALNASLENIEALTNLTAVEELKIYENDNLTSLNGLNNLSGAVEDLVIQDNSVLVNLDELSGINAVDRYLDIRGIALENIDGLGSITRARFLEIYNDARYFSGLTVFQLASLETVEDLEISGSGGSLAQVVLPNLISIENYLEIGGSVATIDLPSLISIGDSLNIRVRTSALNLSLPNTVVGYSVNINAAQATTELTVFSVGITSDDSRDLSVTYNNDYPIHVTVLGDIFRDIQISHNHSTDIHVTVLGDVHRELTFSDNNSIDANVSISNVHRDLDIVGNENISPVINVGTIDRNILIGDWYYPEHRNENLSLCGISISNVGGNVFIENNSDFIGCSAASFVSSISVGGNIEYCDKGECVAICKPPYANCSNDCEDLSSDDDNCGECGYRCSSSKDCVNGTCQY